MTKISITIGIKKRFQKKSTKSQTILPISIYPLTTARTKKGKRKEKEEEGKKKKREGVPRIPARNPLSQEGGDLLSRIAVQYHRRARA
ncbi:MAG: hypothetical protein IJ610_01230 [Bacteroidaceae bacterium]|nr:hypothetical protein [Bacteroidaceae bacterium]